MDISLKQIIIDYCDNVSEGIIFENNEKELLKPKDLKNNIIGIINPDDLELMKETKYCILQIKDKKLFLVAFLGLICRNIIPIVLPTCNNREQFKRLIKIKNENPKAYILCDRLGEEYLKLFIENDRLDLIIVNDEIDEQNIEIEEWNTIKKYCQLVNDEAAILYSSGSTSDPKGVVLTHKEITNFLRRAGDKFQIKNEDVFLTWMPIEHTIGMNFFVFLPMLYKSKIVYFDAMEFIQNPKSWFDYIELHKASITAGPNFSYRFVTNILDDTDNWDLSTLRIIFNGGEPISKQVMEAFKSKTKKYKLKSNALIPSYGLTESTSIVVFDCDNKADNIDIERIKNCIEFDMENVDSSINDIVCQGLPLPGTELRIVDDFNEQLEDYCIGNIQLRGEAICKGYFNGKDEDIFYKGWLKTGDIGFVICNQLYVIGRKKDIVFYGGKNIYLKDIERALDDKYNTRSAACGENNPQNGESNIYVFIELIIEEDINMKKMEMMQFVHRNFGINLKDVIFMDKLLVTEVGKISKGKLMKFYKGGITK